MRVFFFYQVIHFPQWLFHYLKKKERRSGGDEAELGTHKSSPPPPLASHFQKIRVLRCGNASSTISFVDIDSRAFVFFFLFLTVSLSHYSLFVEVEMQNKSMEETAGESVSYRLIQTQLAS